MTPEQQKLFDAMARLTPVLQSMLQSIRLALIITFLMLGGILVMQVWVYRLHKKIRVLQNMINAALSSRMSALERGLGEIRQILR